MSEDKKKMYYYGGKEKKAGEIRKRSESEMAPYSFREIQRDFDSLLDRFEREFEDFWGMPARWRHRMQRGEFPRMPFRGAMMPSVDLEDHGKDFRLTVDLPGFKKEDIEIEISDDSLAIHAEKMQSEEETKKNYIRRERVSQTFYRQIQLPEPVRSDDAKASLNNGILEITLPKKAPKETKKLTITENEGQKQLSITDVGEPKHTPGHSTAITQSEKGEFMCPECGKTFDSKDAAERHLHSEHIQHLRAVHGETHGKDTDKEYQI